MHLFTSQPFTLTLNKTLLNLTYFILKLVFEKYESESSLTSYILQKKHCFPNPTLRRKNRQRKEWERLVSNSQNFPLDSAKKTREEKENLQKILIFGPFSTSLINHINEGNDHCSQVNSHYNISTILMDTLPTTSVGSLIRMTISS